MSTEAGPGEDTGVGEDDEPPEPTTAHVQEDVPEDATEEHAGNEDHSGNYGGESQRRDGNSVASAGFPEPGEGCKLFIAQLSYDTKVETLTEQPRITPLPASTEH